MLESPDVKKTASGLNSNEEYVNHVDKQTVVQCYCCEKRGHIWSQCRFCTYKCHKCGKIGHLQVVCNGDKRKASDRQSRSANVTDIKQVQGVNMAYENHIWGLTGGHKEGYKLLVSINGKPLQMELDTGATVSVISEQD